MALGRRGGARVDELLSFLERGMIRGPGEEEERGEAGQVLRERYVLFFSLCCTGDWEDWRERESEKGQVKYFPLWQRKWGESGKGQLCIEKWTKPFPEGVLKVPGPQASL